MQIRATRHSTAPSSPHAAADSIPLLITAPLPGLAIAGQLTYSTPGCPRELNPDLDQYRKTRF
jgi:hypothetical protein